MMQWANPNSSNMPQTNIIFFGSDAICLPVLQYLHALKGDEIVLRAVVSQPDRPSGRGKKMQANPVAAWANSEGIELLQPEVPGEALASWIEAEGIALSLVMAYGHFLPASLRKATPVQMVNFHGSILPALRGASPVETALANGATQTGVSLMKIVREMDAGGVADLECVNIEETDTAISLRVKIGLAVVPLLERNLMALISGTANFEAQDTALVTYCRKITKDDGALNFQQSARAMDCRLRAFSPWPGGYFDYANTRIKVGRVEVVDSDSTTEPGTVLSADAEGLKVATAEGVLVLLELQRPGGRMLPVDAFLRGFPIEVGACLPSTKGEALERREL